MTNYEIPEFIFLGFCERAAYIQEGNTNIYKWNILGLKQIILSNICPLPLTNINIALAIAPDYVGVNKYLKISDNNGKEVGTMTIFTNNSQQPPDRLGEILDKNYPSIMVLEHGWVVSILPLKSSDFVIMKPGDYYISVINDEGMHIIGHFIVAIIDPPPLTIERIAAIKSDPNASKSVKIEYGCKNCLSVFKAYAALERSQEL